MAPWVLFSDYRRQQSHYGNGEMINLIKLITNFLPTKYFILAGVMAATTGGFFVGFKFAKSIYQDDIVKAYEQAEKTRKRQEKEIALLERKYLTEKEKIKVVYRDKVKQVVKFVDRNNCTVTDDGLQFINDALRPGEG